MSSHTQKLTSDRFDVVRFRAGAMLAACLCLALCCACPVGGAGADESRADVVVLDATHEYTLEPGGDTLFRCVEKKKVCSVFGFNRLAGETFIPYAEGLQELKIVRCATTMVDGKVVPSPENAFNVITPEAAYSYPGFRNLREMVVTHTGLEVGAVTDLEYTVRTKKEFWPFLHGVETLGGEQPVRKMVVVVRVPVGAVLNFACSDAAVKPEVSRLKTGTEYRWTLVDIPATPKEKGVPDPSSGLRSLYFSTSGTGWPGVLDRSGSPPLAVEEARAALGGTVPLDRGWPALSAVLNSVSKGTKLSGVSWSDAGAGVASPAAVYARGYGHALERAGLLAALLRSAGFADASVAALVPDVAGLERVLAPAALRQAWVGVSVDGEAVFLSPDGRAEAPESPMFSGLKLVGSPAQGAPRASVRRSYYLSLRVKDIDGTKCRVSGDIRVPSGGFQLAKAMQDSQKEAKAVLDAIFEGCGFDKADVRVRGASPHALAFAFDADASSFLTSMDGAVWLAAPIPPFISRLKDTLALPVRSAPLAAGLPAESETFLEITLPDGWKTLASPGDAIVESGGGAATRALQTDGNTVRLTDRLVWKNGGVVAPEEYAAFRDWVAEMVRPSRNRFIFKSVKP